METSLILASTSPYRRELIARLGLPFEAKAPLFDEDIAKSNENSPAQLALFLATEKAKSLSTPENCVIGGDQVVTLGAEILGKPKTKENAFVQLSKMNGQSHELLTATAVFYRGQVKAWVNLTKMQMRKLSSDQIRSYIEMDQPLDCAGSYKIEKSGICLFEKIETTDFTAIQGLPLMELTQTLSEFGYCIPNTRSL